MIWTDTAVIQDAFAYETTVANEIRGIGVDVYDASRDFGSGGRLRSLAVMDWLGKYPDDPAQKFLGENNTLSACSGRRSAIAGWRSWSSAIAPASGRRHCSAAAWRTGASSSIPTRR